MCRGPPKEEEEERERESIHSRLPPVWSFKKRGVVVCGRLFSPFLLPPLPIFPDMALFVLPFSPFFLFSPSPSTNRTKICPAAAGGRKGRKRGWRVDRFRNGEKNHPLLGNLNGRREVWKSNWQKCAFVEVQAHLEPLVKPRLPPPRRRRRNQAFRTKKEKKAEIEFSLPHFWPGFLRRFLSFSFPLSPLYGRRGRKSAEIDEKGRRGRRGRRRKGKLFTLVSLFGERFSDLDWRRRNVHD